MGRARHEDGTIENELQDVRVMLTGNTREMRPADGQQLASEMLKRTLMKHLLQKK